jgi:hypothetical protein
MPVAAEKFLAFWRDLDAALRARGVPVIEQRSQAINLYKFHQADVRAATEAVAAPLDPSNPVDLALMKRRGMGVAGRRVSRGYY